MREFPPDAPLPGTVYRVVRVLGRGGMGIVYEVEDTSSGARLVAKTLHAELRNHKELALRMQNEARTLARLSHPNIVALVTAGVTSEPLRLPYVVMPKLDGMTLREVLDVRERLPLAAAYGIALDLLAALSHAHAQGVIHRDVKPENLFLHRDASGSGATKLLDFGIVRVLASDLALSGGRFVGTMRYAAPEQLRGQPVTPRTDLYAAALVLFEMIAGRGPFDDAADRNEIGRAHLERPAPALSTVVVGAPASLEELLASALAKDPAERPSDAIAFAARLREIADRTQPGRTDDRSAALSTRDAAPRRASAGRPLTRRAVPYVVGAVIGVGIALAILLHGR